ncbi:hypothetical protein [Actinomadura xylanilytica]|uniref:hypothetical protein n=1 Tax=Actinomadura xylanilytica TaxID=887459 RepID=UPI00255ADA6D|nr:hypothetical protein [Actinomadura xylanilytica]MDL4770731.1 hypothetical protein [Actinomadura xylanilytica]
MRDTCPNALHVDNAAHALRAYEQDVFRNEMSALDGDASYTKALISGLLCDMEHLATAQGIDFAEAVATGHELYADEIAVHVHHQLGPQARGTALRQQGPRRTAPHRPRVGPSTARGPDPHIHTQENAMTSNTEPEHEDVRGTWFAEILNETLNDLAYAERVITAFADRTPDGFIAWGMAEEHATQARQALTQAPILRGTSPQVTDATPTADALHDLAANAARNLVRAAELAGDPDDQLACLQAALHVGRLRDDLR